MTTAVEEKRYRPNVAAFVLNEQGQVLACRRTDAFKSWQIPQGGIDAGESPERAVLRELQEEIGTNDVDILGRLAQPTRYDWPVEAQRDGFHGQEQHYFLVRLRAGAAIDLHREHRPEFDESEWVTAQEFMGRVGGFKAQAYCDALQQFQNLCPGIILWE